MWKRLMAKLGKGRTQVPGFTEVDEFIEAASNRISDSVVRQMSRVQGTQAQLNVMRSFLLGYVATLAEQLSLASGRADSSNAAMLISLLAAQRIPQVPGDAEELIDEFATYSNQRDVGFGQGGSVALEDYELVAQGREANGLLAYFRPRS